jgi:hypothetical protein
MSSIERSRQTTYNTPRYICRRLVVTGKDTPDNLSLLFGTNPQDNADLIYVCYGFCVQLLVSPPPGSEHYEQVVRGKMDDGCPPWSPRLPYTPSETCEAAKMFDLQSKIRQVMAPLEEREYKSMTLEDFSGEC